MISNNRGGNIMNNTNDKKPALGIRVLLQVASFLLCMILMLGLLVAVALIDLKTATSSEGIETVINLLIAADRPTQSQPQMSFQGDKAADRSVGPVLLSASNGEYEIPDDIDIPYDVLTDADALADFIVETLNEYAGESIDVDRETVFDFINDSSIIEYTSQKVSGYLQDALGGTEDTVITTDEIMSLFDDNKQLIEQTFDITVTDEMEQKIRSGVEEAINENDLNGNIRRGIDSVMQQPLDGTDITVSDIAAFFGRLTAVTTLLLVFAICLLLAGLLFLANYYKLAKGLTWVSVSFMLSGLIPALLPALLCGLAQHMITEYAGIITEFTALFAPLHYGFAIAGVLMLAASVAWRILIKKHRAPEPQTVVSE